VGGKNGLPILLAKFRTNGISVFFQGSIAAAAATIVGHYPWFFVFNYLTDALPKSNDFTSKLCRSAVIGFCSSAVSDTCSNSIRVVKVYKQSSTDAISYPKALKRILKEDGIIGVFGRGLKTKIIANGMQGIMFSVLYKLIDERLFPREETDKEV
jgi:Mitochondrial carrier protein